VSAVDRYDGEIGEVHDARYDGSTSTLSFCVYWNSTGRLVKARLLRFLKIAYHILTPSPRTKCGSEREATQPLRRVAIPRDRRVLESARALVHEM
jgi:hypothetical protein